jgi:hypothetical protein
MTRVINKRNLFVFPRTVPRYYRRIPHIVFGVDVRGDNEPSRARACIQHQRELKMRSGPLGVPGRFRRTVMTKQASTERPST